MPFEIAVAGNAPPEGESGAWCYYRIVFSQGVDEAVDIREGYHRQVDDNTVVGASPNGRIQGVWSGSGTATVQILDGNPGLLPAVRPLVGGRVVQNNSVVTSMKIGDTAYFDETGQVENPPAFEIPDLSLPNVSLGDVATAAGVLGAAGAAAYAADTQLSRSE